MGNSPSIQSQYMTLLKGLLKGSGVKVKDKSFQELLHHFHRHCYWFHPEGRTILNYEVWKKVMRALRRAQQRGDIIPVHVWSLWSLISSVLKPMSTDSEESRQVVTDTESDMGHISQPCASADEFISQPLPPLPSQKNDEKLFKQLKNPRQNKESSPGQSAASSDHDSSQHESGSGSSSDESLIMVQKSQYRALMAEVEKSAHNMDKCDLSTGLPPTSGSSTTAVLFRTAGPHVATPLLQTLSVFLSYVSSYS
jgi:hypothetical protein